MSNDSSSLEPTDTPNNLEASPRAKDRVTWGPFSAIIYAIVVYFVAQYAAAFIVSGVVHAMGWSTARISDWFQHAITAQFWFVFLAEALTFIGIWWFIRVRGSSLRAIGWKRIRLWNIVQALGGYLVYFIAYIVVLSLVTHLIPNLNINQKQELGFDNASGGIGLVLTFLSLVVFPPIAEEVVFRGFVYGGLRTKLKPVLAALATSALFATAHLQFGSGQPLLWVAALDTFTLSLVLCYLREKSGSLWPGIMLHALKNLVAFMSLYAVIFR